MIIKLLSALFDPFRNLRIIIIKIYGNFSSLFKTFGIFGFLYKVLHNRNFSVGAILGWRWDPLQETFSRYTIWGYYRRFFRGNFLPWTVLCYGYATVLRPKLNATLQFSTSILHISIQYPAMAEAFKNGYKWNKIIFDITYWERKRI